MSTSKLDPTDPKYIDEDEAKRLSVVYGGMAGGLDFASAGAMLNRVLNIGEEPAKKYLQRLAMNLPAGVFVEGATEAAQEFLAIAAEKYAQGQSTELTPDEINRLIDAGVLGALGGAQFTAISAIKGPAVEPEKAKMQGGDAENRPSVEELDARQKKLPELLKDKTTTDYTPEVGMDVQAGLGVQGKVKEIRGDGMVSIELENGSEVEVGYDTLAPKMRTAEELEAVIAENNDLADDGDTSAQIEVVKAQQELIDQTPTPPADTQEVNPAKSVHTFGRGPNPVPKLTTEEVAEMNEVYEGLVKIAKEGLLPGHMMSTESQINNAMGAEFTAKWNKYKSKLRDSGLLSNNYTLSQHAANDVGLGMNDNGTVRTLLDQKKVEERQKKDEQKRIKIIAERNLNPDQKVKLRNPEVVEKDGGYYLKDETFEVEKIVDSKVKLKGKEELYEPSDLINATVRRRVTTRKGKGGKNQPSVSYEDLNTPTVTTEASAPTKSIDDLAKDSLSGKDISGSVNEVVQTFLKNQGGEQGNTIAPENQGIAKQLGINFDENGIVKTDEEGKAVTTEVNQDALNDFFSVNSQILNDPTAQQLAMMLKNQKQAEQLDEQTPDVDTLLGQIPEKPTQPVQGFHSTDSDKISKFETNPRKVIGDREVQMGAHFGATKETVKKDRKHLIEVKADLKNLLRMPDLNQWTWQNVEPWLLENGIFTEEDTKIYKNIKETGGLEKSQSKQFSKTRGMMVLSTRTNTRATSSQIVL